MDKIKKVGLAGFGFIGNFLFNQLAERDDIAVDAIWVEDPTKTAGLDPKIVCTNPEDLCSRRLDLLVEVAHPSVVPSLWHHIKPGTNIMIASMTSMANAEFRRRVFSDAKRNGQRVYFPHGAILGLDGLRDGRALLESVTVTTTKNPYNLGLANSDIKMPQTLFEGSTKEACALFPRNVNVHAAVALAGLGFESTRSVVLADPDTRKMRHHIEVRGRGLNWSLEIESYSAGQVTGSYTPESLYQSLLGILLKHSGFCIV